MRIIISQSEVYQFQRVVRASDDDVFGFDVIMNNAAFMQILYGRKEFGENAITLFF